MTRPDRRDPTTWPDTVEVGEHVWRLRRYTPKRRGGPAGRGWLRRRDSLGYPAGQVGRSDGDVEVGARERDLVDEVARLRWLAHELAECVDKHVDPQDVVDLLAEAGYTP